MTDAIHKQPLELVGIQTLWMPTRAEVLCVQLQRGEPCVWYRTPVEEKSYLRAFHTYGTGHPLPTNVALRYVGTYQLEGGALVFHVFEEVSP